MQNDDEKSLKQRQLEQVGSKGARAAADLATGGAYEKVRNVPVVGNVAKGVENAAGKAAGSLDKLNQRRINLPSRMSNINNDEDEDNTNPDSNGSLPNNEGLGNNEPLIEKNQDDEQEEKEDKKKDGNFFGDKSSDDNSPFNFDGIKKAVKAYKAIKVGMILAPILLIFIVIAMGFAMVFGPINSAADYLKNTWDSIVSFFNPDQKTLEENYYKELKRVQTTIDENQSVCIDANLITSTLTIGNVYFGNDYNSDRLLNDENTKVEYNKVDGSQSDENYEGSSINNIEYSNKMSEQIVLLAAMQIKHKKYSLDSKATSYCKNTEEEVLVNSSNQDSFSKDFLGWLKGNPTNIDSSSPQLVAANDNSGIFTYSVPKAVREQNFEYYIYYPPFDSDGSCSKSYAEKKLKEKNEKNSAEVSIGNDGDFTESVYYWNLVNDFIPDYYDDYLPSAEPDRTETILDLADQVFLVYKQMGSSQTCTTADIYTVQSNLCPNGIVIEGVGTIDLEDYIAGVVAAENSWHQGDNIENLKAQAIASRTYALTRTNNCQTAIKNSTANQVYKSTTDPYMIRAAQETRGMVIRKNGEIYTGTEYDAFCVTDNSGSNYTIMQKNQSIPKSFADSNGAGWSYTHCLCNQSSNFPKSEYPRCYSGNTYLDGGHGRGMSQIGSRYLQTQGYTFDKILAYYYGDDIQLTQSLPTVTLTSATSVASDRIDQVLLAHGSSIQEFNSYIASNVVSAGVGTREGVVTAAISLIQGFEDRTGLKLPYKWGGTRSGVYGAVGSWKNGEGGLDCSGFVSWAVFNGGYTYDSRLSGDWTKAGIARTWTKGMYDDKALPGDLVGSPGHIQMIVGVTETSYITAEASSSKNGLRIRELSFKSVGTMELVDMSNYYATRKKQTSYPG